MTRNRFFRRSIAIRFVIILSFVSYCLSLADAQDDKQSSDSARSSLVAIAGHGMMDGHAYDYLEELSDQIGGRLTGSPQAQRAIEWGLMKMRAMGLENVHAEKWQLSRGWKRVSASAELASPIRRALRCDSMGWVASTPAAGVEGDLLSVNAYQLQQEVQENGSSWRGKILLMVRRGEPPANGNPRERFAALEVVLIGAHLVSCDLAQGSTDDGTGTSVALGAAETILASGKRPKRTIRFVLFTGEEQGLLGSFAYVKSHRNDLGTHIAAIVLDNGQGPVTKLNLGGRKELISVFETLTSSL